MDRKQTINQFLDSLGVRLAARRPSWDAFDEATDTVVMKLWFKDEELNSGETFVRIWTAPRVGSNKAPIGRAERLRSIAHLSAGRPTYAVMRHGTSSSDPAAKEFDAEHLRKLSAVVRRDNGDVLVKVEGLVTVDQFYARVRPRPILANDIRDIERRYPGPANATTRQALVEARLGQGRYRAEVLAKWGNACAVTGCTHPDLIIASHAMAWSDPAHDDDTKNKKRLDSNNGLPLIANLDKLFDKHLVAFNPDTKEMLVSKELSRRDRDLLGVPMPLRKMPSREQAEYIRYHLGIFKAMQQG